MAALSVDRISTRLVESDSRSLPLIWISRAKKKQTRYGISAYDILDARFQAPILSRIVHWEIKQHSFGMHEC